MSLQVEKLENNMAKLTIEVPADDLEKALQSAYMKQKNKIAMPGFRKGKVPRQMIEKMYGPEIFYDDAANALILRHILKHMKSVNLRLFQDRRSTLFRLKRKIIHLYSRCCNKAGSKTW